MNNYTKEACANCRKRCLLLHGTTGNDSTTNSYSFFKIMFGDGFSNTLFFPPRVAPFILPLINKEVKLEDGSGKQWKARVYRTQDSCALGKGWKLFVSEHGVELGDFLVFHYVGEAHFLVDLYSWRTSCHTLDFKTVGNSSSSSSNPLVCPDPDFHDFASNRRESLFSEGQIWALYDEFDAMPRFYARIQKVFSPGFKMNIRWLEHSDEKDERDWVCGDFSHACGDFKLGKTLTVESCDLFSHLVLEKRGRESTYKIFPGKGEVWALFMNWKASGKSGPVANRIDYEFVEILSDFSEDEGACVVFLDKVEGFVSLFCRTKKENMNNVQIKELFRFSHMVPYSPTTAIKREDVPRGSLVLDTAALQPKARGIEKQTHLSGDDQVAG